MRTKRKTHHRASWRRWTPRGRRRGSPKGPAPPVERGQSPVTVPKKWRTSPESHRASDRVNRATEASRNSPRGACSATAAATTAAKLWLSVQPSTNAGEGPNDPINAPNAGNVFGSAQPSSPINAGTPAINPTSAPTAAKPLALVQRSSSINGCTPALVPARRLANAASAGRVSRPVPVW